MDKNYETVRRITLAINKMDGAYYLLARHYQINENTLIFLYALDDGHPHSQREISDEWLIPRTTINSLVKKLLSDGYIALLENSMRRRKHSFSQKKAVHIQAACFMKYISPRSRQSQIPFRTFRRNL